MGKIKKDIRKLSKEAGSKSRARKEAEDWFTETNKKRANKEVHSIGTRFEPGKIYVFEYKTPKTLETLEWWDKHPVVLALDRHDRNDVGINLNLLPIQVKEEMLDMLYDRLAGQIKSNSTGAKAKNAEMQRPLNFTYKGAIQYLKRYGYDFAIRQYIPNLKTKQAVVSYENWAKIALCDFVDLEGITLTEMKKRFKQHLKK